jgi:hypothetical protein
MMTDKPYYEESEGARLRSWMLGQMMRGAGYAALFVVGAGLFLYALYGISLLLPEESKQAPSPNLGALERPLIRVIV